MKTKSDDRMKTLLVKVPEELHKALKIRAVETDQTISAIVEEMIREYLAKGE